MDIEAPWTVICAVTLFIIIKTVGELYHVVYEDRIRRRRRRFRRQRSNRRRQQQQRPNPLFMIYAVVDTVHECRRALADRMNVIINYGKYREYCCSEADVRNDQPRMLNTQCSICFEEFQATDACIVLGECRHVHHEQCIRPWFKRNRSCPICRSQIPLFTFE